LPPQITITLPTGQAFIGSYSIEGGMTGFDFGEDGETVLLTYCGDGRFDARIFDRTAMEISYSPTHRRFQIEIKPNHLLPYCYGIVSFFFLSLSRWFYVLYIFP
jgi:hypothetical protein